jgi:hypothetical protein
MPSKNELPKASLISQQQAFIAVLGHWMAYLYGHTVHPKLMWQSRCVTLEILLWLEAQVRLKHAGNLQCLWTIP